MHLGSYMQKWSRYFARQILKMFTYKINILLIHYPKVTKGKDLLSKGMNKSSIDYERKRIEKVNKIVFNEKKPE